MITTCVTDLQDPRTCLSAFTLGVSYTTGATSGENGRAKERSRKLDIERGASRVFKTNLKKIPSSYKNQLIRIENPYLMITNCFSFRGVNAGQRRDRVGLGSGRKSGREGLCLMNWEVGWRWEYGGMYSLTQAKFA